MRITAFLPRASLLLLRTTPPLPTIQALFIPKTTRRRIRRIRSTPARNRTTGSTKISIRKREEFTRRGGGVAGDASGAETPPAGGGYADGFAEGDAGCGEDFAVDAGGGVVGV